jgi:hypothetical protein
MELPAVITDVFHNGVQTISDSKVVQISSNSKVTNSNKDSD